MFILNLQFFTQHWIEPSGFAGDGEVRDLAGLHQPPSHLTDLGLQQLLRQPHPLRISFAAVSVSEYAQFVSKMRCGELGQVHHESLIWDR